MMSRQSAFLLCRLFLLGFVVYFILDGLPAIVAWRLRRDSTPPPRPTLVEGLAITHFKVAPNPLPAGQSATLCYGTTGAATVTLDPPLAPVAPALHRCLQLAPAHSTRITLTAESTQRARVTRTVTLTVAAAR